MPPHRLPRYSRSESGRAMRTCILCAQRPLARQQVLLSCRVNAYYGLIRGPDPLPSSWPIGIQRRVFARGLRPGLPQFKLHVFRSVPPALPRRSGGQDCCSSARVGLRPMRRGSAPAMFPPEVGSRRGNLSRLTLVRLSLRPGSLPALHRQGQIRSSLHAMSHLISRRTSLRGQTVNLPRPDSHRLDTQPYGLHSHRVSPRLFLQE